VRTACTRVPRRPTRTLTNATDDRACRCRLLRCGSAPAGPGEAVDAGGVGVVEAALSGGGGSPQRSCDGHRCLPSLWGAAPDRAPFPQHRELSSTERVRQSTKDLLLVRTHGDGVTHGALRARRPSPTAPAPSVAHARASGREERESEWTQERAPRNRDFQPWSSTTRTVEAVRGARIARGRDGLAHGRLEFERLAGDDGHHGLVLGVVACLAFVVIRASRSPAVHARDPEQILAERLAAGEIDEDEYRRRLDALRGAAKPARQ
jgi:Short C-terminal domain